MKSEQQQPKEYIITEDMIAQWRSGCVNWRSQDENKCYECQFDGKGFRKGCCDFGDVEMQKIFQSRPHPAPAERLGFTEFCYVHCDKHECCTNECERSGYEAARKAREDVLKELQDYYSNLPEHEASCPFDKMNSDECQGMEGYCETCILNHAIEFLRGERK